MGFAIGLLILVLGLVEMTRGLVHASYSLPVWQAVKLTFSAPTMLRLIPCAKKFPLKTLLNVLMLHYGMA